MNALIKTIKHFIRISSEEETVIANLFTESRLKPGEYFLEEGKVCRSVRTDQISIRRSARGKVSAIFG